MPGIEALAGALGDQRLDTRRRQLDHQRTVPVIRFQTSVRIERPVDEVFAYVSDPENFPSWNSAVRTVRKTSSSGGPLGATYAMTRQLPSGQAENELEITAHERPREFAIRTLSGPTPFVYRYAFSASDGGTLLDLDAEVELPGPATLVEPLARRAVKRGVDDNFARLKGALERRSS